MNQPHQGKTSAQHGTTRIPISLQQDFITVVGASPMTLLESLRGQNGNKMRFINQGIRQTRLYPPATASAQDEAIVQHADSRDKNDRLFGYPLDEEGAVRGVRAGDTPTGVPATLREYRPL
jgi:hypothetical protein